MLSFLTRITLFLAFLTIAWGGLWLVAMNIPIIEARFIAQEKDWGYVNKKTAEWIALREKERMDILFFGSSTCYEGIDPQAFLDLGYNTFNFCSSAQTLEGSDLLLHAALKDQNPDYVVLDIYPRNWDGELPVEHALDWVVNGNLWDDHWTKSIREITIKSQSLYALLISFYYPLRRQIEPAGNHASPDRLGSYRGRGFVFRTNEPLQNIPADSPKSVSLNPAHDASIMRIRRTCEERGIHLFVVNPPQLIEEEFQIPESLLDLTWIEGNQWPGAKVPSNYRDDHHLVGNGAISYSHWLAKQFKAQAESLR